jgi:Tfp pilus assembly protein PilO
MSSKVKNTIIILILFIIIGLGSVSYNFVYQKAKINEKNKKIASLKQFRLDTESLNIQLALYKKRVAELDSVLANRKYNIPFNVSQASFFDFVNQVSYGFSSNSFVNVEFNETETGTNYNIYHYTLNGVAEFNDLIKLIYAIEESKQLKKIESVELSSNVKVDVDGMPHYLVKYSFKAKTYFSADNRFLVKDLKENSIVPNPAFDFFYPLIRNEIPPNRDKLLDVQSAQLLALIPDGAFLVDASGNTYLLWEGDQVYLGYLTNINYQNTEVNFVLNKGGIIENVTLKLVKEKKPSK